MSQTYGICYGSKDDTTIRECGTLKAAMKAALSALYAQNGLTSVDVIELEGTGPVYADDGTKIADTHAPQRTVTTMIR